MKNLTDITIVLDRSGSMQTIKSDMEGAFGNFIAEQSAVTSDECLVSLYQFDTQVDCVYSTRPLSLVPKLDIVPRGGTALNDGLAYAIADTGARLSRLSEEYRPARVVFVVITDGDENSSREYSAHQVKNMVKHQTDKYNWQFVYLGANQDAFEAGRGLGFHKGSTANYTADHAGVTGAWGSVGSTLAAYRRCAQPDMSLQSSEVPDAFTKEAFLHARNISKAGSGKGAWIGKKLGETKSED